MFKNTFIKQLGKVCDIFSAIRKSEMNDNPSIYNNKYNSE